MSSMRSACSSPARKPAKNAVARSARSSSGIDSTILAATSAVTTRRGFSPRAMISRPVVGLTGTE
jgi:hypothetical protein